MRKPTKTELPMRRTDSESSEIPGEKDEETVLIISIPNKQHSQDYPGGQLMVQPVSNPDTPIGEILKAAGTEGVLLESEGQGSFALIPLDDDLIDFLVERNPRFRADCHEIRGRMQARQSQTHEDVRRQLVEE
jgi:hypothetical protein